jgi:predicted nucleotidyltransferase component of viral defense system
MSIKSLDLKTLNFVSDKYNINPAFIEKDWYTQHVLGIVAGIQSDEFQPIFCGGTSLSKGYQLIRRFSEDIDFKVQTLKPNLTRSFRSAYQDKIVETVLASAPELGLAREVYKRNRSTFLKFELTYPSQYPQSNALRTNVKIEFTFEEPALAPQVQSLSSTVAQIMQQPPEIDRFPCVSLVETAADKIAALSWRIFSQEPDGERYDPRIIRHVYDLAYLAPRIIDNPDWRDLTLETVDRDLRTRDRDLAASISDSQDFVKALVPRLRNNPLYAKHYQEFVQLLSYENNPIAFAAAIDSLEQIVDRLTAPDLRLTINKPIKQRSNSDSDTDDLSLGG